MAEILSIKLNNSVDIRTYLFSRDKFLYIIPSEIFFFVFKKWVSDKYSTYFLSPHMKDQFILAEVVYSIVTIIFLKIQKFRILLKR